MFFKLSLLLVLIVEISGNSIVPRLDKFSADSSESNGLDKNPPGLYQGDIKLTDEQKKLIADPNIVVIDTVRHWPMNLEGFVDIPYVFDPQSGYSPEQIQWMLDQMKQMEDVTCVRFIEKTYQIDFLSVGNYGGCWSWIGRVGGRQEVSMSIGDGQNCLWGHIMMHEMMHAIGIEHMHNAFDRDDYVTIQLRNVRPGRWGSFNKIDPSIFDKRNTPYDLRSVTHYGRRAFSILGLDSIVPLDLSYIDIIGTQPVFSDGDALRVNRMHMCVNRN